MKVLRLRKNAELTSSLIKSAYETIDDVEYWRIIRELHSRGSLLEFDAATLLAKSVDPLEREIGADILGQLDWSERKFHDDCVSILIELLNDSDPKVIASAAFSLGHRSALSAVEKLVTLIDHTSPWVREGVVFGLIGLDDEAAVNALILLSRDTADDVRDWATFGLASLCEADYSGIRSALFERITDQNNEIRGEALIGLAARKDLNVHDAVLRELEGEFYGGWAIEAAELLASPDFLAALEKIKLQLLKDTDERFLQDIDDAILACGGRKT